MKYHNVVITGGAGFIGSCILEKLVEYNCEITIIDNLSMGSTSNIEHLIEKVNFIKADISNVRILNKAFKGKDIVFHIAAQKDLINSYKNPFKTSKTNLNATILILETMRKQNVPNILFDSSAGTIYG